MFCPEVNFDGIEINYINEDSLRRTVRLVPMSQRSNVSTGELLNGLCGARIQPDEIAGIYKVSAADSAFSIYFKFNDTVGNILQIGEINAGNVTFQTMRMTEQIVTIRVHWLPLYYDDALLKEILGEFGEVQEIRLLRTAHANVVVFDGVREVRMKVDEFKKQMIPHVVRLNSGQAILFTMAGRPPYCLKCKSVGHVRQRCPKKQDICLCSGRYG